MLEFNNTLIQYVKVTGDTVKNFPTSFTTIWGACTGNIYSRYTSNSYDNIVSLTITGIKLGYSSSGSNGIHVLAIGRK